jgi:UDPglucose 6-dehydrogenase
VIGYFGGHRVTSDDPFFLGGCLAPGRQLQVTRTPNSERVLGNHQSISVVGMGKLGFPLALCLAFRNFRTMGVDIDAEHLDRLGSNAVDFDEPSLADIWRNCKDRLTLTDRHADAIAETGSTFILVNTASDQSGGFANDALVSALRSLAEALRTSRKDYHLFVIGSTVMPGTHADVVLPTLEEYSKRKAGEGFGVCYCPEFVMLGDVAKGFLYPERVVIGEGDRGAGDKAQEIYRMLCPNQPPTFRMSLASAELAKITHNCYLTLKITYANYIGRLCEQLPDANVDTVLRAVGVDSRIGNRFFRAGLSYGGPCFPRDTKALIAFAGQLGDDAVLFHAVETMNQRQDEYLYETVNRHLAGYEHKSAAILGLAFKPGTSVLTGSPAIKLIHRLVTQGIRVCCHDPLALDGARKLLGESVTFCSSAQECVKRASVTVVTTQDENYRAMAWSEVRENITLIDCWRYLKAAEMSPSIRYVGLSAQ